MPQWESLPFQYRSSNDQSENGGVFNRKVGVFVRKAGYHFGWDWGPRLLTSGIWRPAYLEAWDELRIYMVSDRLKNSCGTLSIQLVDMNGGIINRQEMKVAVPANASLSVWKERSDSLLAGLNRANLLLHVEYVDVDGSRYENKLFFAKQKEINYPKVRIDHLSVPVAGGFELTMTSDAFARGVFVSLNGKDDFISDNYMDLLPGRSVTISVTTL